ncbi:MAG: helix-turn-helix transcriptional regulator [Oscillospiraceae bacterium]|nr:helix-turn-helix transcriptional regulator [Oscillospiraceae bacterium]
MEIAKTIKQHRAELGWSQEVLAEKAYVSRQTVSNWETEKSYPDVHSLLILSDLFGVSLDELIKGDVAVMKEQVKSKDVRTFKKLQLIGGLGILLLIVTGMPLLEYGGAVGGVVWGALAVGVFLAWHRFEQIKSENDVQTYREVLAFVNGETLDDIERTNEAKKRRSLKILEIIVAAQAIILLIVCAGVIIFELMQV